MDVYNVYKEILTEEDLLILKKLLNSKLLSISCDNLTIDMMHQEYITKSVNVNFENSNKIYCLNIEKIPKRTRSNRFYFKFNFFIRDDEQIKTDKTVEFIPDWNSHSLCSTYINNVINKVEIYDKQYMLSNEYIEFDYKLLVFISEGYSFSITLGDNLTDRIALSISSNININTESIDTRRLILI